MSKNLDIVWTNQFKKDYNLAMKRHLDIDLLDDIIRKLASGEQLPDKNKDCCGQAKLYRLRLTRIMGGIYEAIS